MDELPLRKAGQRNFWSLLSDIERQALKDLGVRRHVYARDKITSPAGPSMTIPMSPCWIRLQAGTTPEHRSIMDVIPPGGLCSPAHATNPDTPAWLGDIAEFDRYVLRRGQVLELTGEIVLTILSDLPNVARIVRELQVEHLHFSQQLIASTRLDVEVRLARLLLQTLYRFGERDFKGRNALAPPLSQSDLAAWVGASDTHIERIIARWKRRGTIFTGRCAIGILNPKDLRDTANAQDIRFSRFPAIRDRKKQVDISEGKTRSLSGFAATLPPGMP